MKLEELAAAARKFPPMNDGALGNVHRCAARLTDGLYLPCVAIRSSEPWTDLAIRRFDETMADAKLPFWKRQLGKGVQYRDIVRTFAAGGTRVEWFHIASVEESPFALPLERLAEIKGETSMSWTQFVAVMKDGREFSFGTSYSTEFFDMPAGYTARDVARILLHESRSDQFIRERPFFTCYLDAAI